MAGNGTQAGLVAVVGSVNTDYVMRVAHRPRPGETVTDAVLEVHGGGKGANQALAAAKCGARVELLSRVGDDPMGKARLEQLTEEGVGTTRVLVTPGVASGVAVITLTPDGENDIIVAPGAYARLSPADMEGASEQIGRATVLLAQFEVPMETVTRAVQLASGGAQVVINCAPFRPVPPAVLERADVVVVNELEAAQLSGLPVSSPEDVLAAAPRVLGLGPRAVVVTMGAQGAVVVSDDFSAHIPAPATNPVDTTGAGDAFAGALAATLAMGNTLLEAAKLGVVVGSATTEHVGAAAVVPQQVRRWSSGEEPSPAGRTTATTSP
ncbi:MAG: ribokinase [Actinomycetota bacterium]|jgi:ribokinase|nr:ribokinase [Actinomycetota bacterium]